MYTVVKQNGYWLVVCKSSGRVQYRTLSRKGANEWRDANTMENVK